MPGVVVKKIDDKMSKFKTKTVILKPSIKSKVLKDYILSTLTEQKETVDKSQTLSELIKRLFTGDEVTIKDCYSTLVTFLVLNWKDVTYDQFVGSYESVKLSNNSKHIVCQALPYGALIASGLILKWEAEQQNQVVSKMLKIYQNDPECANVVLPFLIALSDNVKLLNPKVKKMSIDSPMHLYFMLSVDSKQECTGHSVFMPESLTEIIDAFLQEPDDKSLYLKISTLLAKKLLSFDSETILKFWKKLMKSFADPRTDYKELIVLQLLSSILQNCDNSDFEIQGLFTPEVIKILSKASPKIDPVFKLINSSLKSLSSKLSGDAKLAIVEAIVVNTDKYIEKSLVVKICDTLVSNMSFEEVTHVTELYKKVIMGEKHKALKQKKMNHDFTEFEKIYCIRFLGKLVGLNSCKHQVKWRKTQLKFLFKIGFLSENSDTISKHMAGISRKTFFLCLNQKFAKLSDLDSVLKKLVILAGERLNNKEENLLVPFKDDAYNLWFKTLNVLKKIKDNDDEDNIVFKVLLRYMMIFMFSNFKTAKSTLEELFEVIENKSLNSGELHWTEVTVDMFLHLLSGDDNTHRNVIHSTFSHVCKHITMKGLNLILSAVKGKETSDDESSEENSDDSESSEDESDENSRDDEDVESDSDESIEENEGQIDKLKDALRQELFKIDTASTCGSVDIDDLDEEEGKNLNSTLGEIFKIQHSKYKSSAKNKVDNVELHFRIRVLNLLEVYIENDPSLYSSTVILTSCISQLKEAVPNHFLAPFTVSLKRCLKKLTDLKEFKDCDSVTETSLCSIFNQIIIRDCPASVYQDITEQIVDGCLFIIRSSTLLSESSGEMLELIKSTLKDFFKDVDNHVPFLLFNSIFSTFKLETLIHLTSELVKVAFSDSVKYHKRTQALQLLMTFYNNNRLFKDIAPFKQSLIKLEEKILVKSLKFIITTSDASEMNKKFGCMFLDLLCLLRTKNELLEDDPGPHWNGITEIIHKISEIAIFQKELRLSFVNFCKIFNTELPKVVFKTSENTASVTKSKKKRKSSISEAAPSSLSPKKKKKQKNNNNNNK